MSASWTLDLETSIFATVKYRAIPILKTQFPKISDTNFTMDNIVQADAEFPNIYIHFLPSAEIGNDLLNQTINGIRTTFQCEVTVNSDSGLNGCRYITSVMLEQFKALGFTINALPEFNGNTSDTRRMVFRGTRVYGANDTL